MIIIQRINLINIDIVEFILVIKLVHVVGSAIYLHLPRLWDAAQVLISYSYGCTSLLQSFFENYALVLQATADNLGGYLPVFFEFLDILRGLDFPCELDGHGFFGSNVGQNLYFHDFLFLVVFDIMFHFRVSVLSIYWVGICDQDSGFIELVEFGLLHF